MYGHIFRLASPPPCFPRSLGIRFVLSPWVAFFPSDFWCGRCLRKGRKRSRKNQNSHGNPGRTKLTYPPTKTVDQVDEYHGEKVKDPIAGSSRSIPRRRDSGSKRKTK